MDKTISFFLYIVDKENMSAENEKKQTEFNALYDRILNYDEGLERLQTVEEKKANIGFWGMRHKRYLNQNHKVRYYNLLTSGKLNSYLSDIEQQAQDLFLRLVKDLAEKENVTEELKAENQMLWMQKMNNIRNRATEIVNKELICF